MLVLVAGLAGAGCGGGQIAGQNASATTATQAATPPSPTTATAPSTTASKRAARDRSPSSASRSTTTTQPPASTTPATTTPPSATATHTTPEPAAVAGTPIDETAQLTLVSKQSATEYTQHGTVAGTYSGEMTLTAKITNDGIAVRFTVATPEGAVTGHGLAIVHITGAALEPIAGTAAITGGTGRFASAHGRGLKVKGRVALDASRGVVHLAGTVFL